MKLLAIVGAGGHGKVIAEIAELNGWTVSFFDDKSTGTNGHWQIRGTTTDLFSQREQFQSVFVAIGSNQVRHRLNQTLKEKGFELPTLIHPTAQVSKYAELSDACVVMANASINPFATIERGCIINTGAIVEHDCKLGQSVHISPGASLAGTVTVGSYTWIGLNSSIIQGLTIGKNVVVGAGSAVIRDIQDNVVVAGSPARVIKEIN